MIYWLIMQMDGKPKEEGLSIEVLEKAKQKAESLYAAFAPEYCPYLKTKVLFNSKGLEHIKFKSWNKPRLMADQFQRLKLVHLIPQVLRESHTVQGRWETKEWERQKKHGKWQKSMKDVTYYEFVAVIERVRMKIIVKEVIGNPPFFWSVIPYWKTNEITGSRILHDQDIVTDGNFSDGLRE